MQLHIASCTLAAQTDRPFVAHAVRQGYLPGVVSWSDSFSLGCGIQLSPPGIQTSMRALILIFFWAPMFRDKGKFVRKVWI